MFDAGAGAWRCWERTTLAGLLNGPQGLLVRAALFDARTRVYQSEFRWPALVRLGPNDFAGRYAQVTLRFGDLHWSFEAATPRDAGAGDRRTLLLVRPLDPGAARHVQLRLETLFLREADGQVVSREREVVARRGSQAWRVFSPSPAAQRSGTTIIAPLRRPFACVIEPLPEGGRRLETRDALEHRPADADAPLTPDERDIIAAVQHARADYLAQFARVPPEFWWIYAAIVYGIGWNTIWAADRREPLQVCSRDWCVHGNYGAWVLFNWDTFLLVPAAGDYDAGLAHQILRPQLSVQTADGLVPGIASPLGVSADRGMPPVAGLGVWKTYLRTRDRSFVDEYYEPLCRYHDWWRRRRDGNGDGLLEWGSDPVPAAHPQWQAHTVWASRYETGMDNHPTWDEVRFNPTTHTQEQSDVGLNALHAADALCLARMADLLGRPADAERFRLEAHRTGELIERHLWNDEVGLWLCRDWNGDWCRRASPCCFYPLLLPTTDPQRVARAVREHLRSPKRFGGRYVLPVSPRDDPAYGEQYYVRGRIWPAQTLLVHWALREAGREADAAWLARGCVETFRDEWLREGHLHENYHAETADGDDTPESDPLYSFGVMLPQAAWNHLRDVRIDGRETRGTLEAFDGHLDTDGSLRRAVDPPP